MSFVFLVIDYMYNLAALLVAFIALVGLISVVFVVIARTTRENVMDTLLATGSLTALLVLAWIVKSYQ